MTAPDANATVDSNATNEPPSLPVMAPMTTRPTFHVSREMVCFLGGIAVVLGVLYISAQIQKTKRDH